MPDAGEIDHINGDCLDNRRENLRKATRSQNMANQPKIGGTWSSHYKGVTWFKQRQKWRAQIKIEGRNHHLGLFINEDDAAKAYDEAAFQAFGEFAHLNFKEGGDAHDSN
jgi:HNH endonuclease